MIMPILALVACDGAYLPLPSSYNQQLLALGEVPPTVCACLGTPYGPSRLGLNCLLVSYYRGS